MLIAICSDAHGARRHMDALLENLPEIDALCFLGDMERDAVYLHYGLQEVQPRAAFYAVRGNNDPFSREAETLELTLSGTRTLLTHGHLYQVKTQLAPLARRASARHCSLALYGHTHIPLDSTISGVRLINPGALMRGLWALLSIDDEGIAVQFLRDCVTQSEKPDS